MIFTRVCLRGRVVTVPRLVSVGQRVAVANFRLACRSRRLEEITVPALTGSYHSVIVTAVREHARIVGSRVMRGDRLILVGMVTVRETRGVDPERGVSVELLAERVWSERPPSPFDRPGR